MNKFIKVASFLIVMFVVQLKATAQVDPHFSQYYVYPSWLNPALTGVFDGDYRVSAIHRTQWGNITSPFSTTGLTVDFVGDKNLNFGGSILRQSAGDGGYNYTTAYFNIAYTGVRFGVEGNQRLVFAMQGGLIERKFNPTKMTWGDQWNPTSGFNPSNPTTEIIAKNNATAFDAGAGLFYYDAAPGKKSNFFAGLSATHLTMPEDKFSSNSADKLPIRYTFHTGIRLVINDHFSITPNALYLKQRTASETMIGAYAQMKAPAANTDFLVGLNYRINDAISPYAGFNYKNFTVGLSYDVNTSDLSKMQKGANSFELSLSYTGRKKAKTSEAEFICPRL